MIASAGDIKGDREVASGKLIKLESDIQPKFDGSGKQTTRYSWRVTAAGSDGKLVEIDSYKTVNIFIATAQAGTTLKVDLTVVDFEAKIFDEASAVVKVTGVGPKPPPGPDPTPDPDSPLVSSLRAALAADLDTKKNQHCNALAEVYSQLASEVKKESGPKTIGQVNRLLLAGNEAAGLDGKLGTVKSVIASHCQKIPTKSAHVLTDADRVLIVITFADVASALKEVSK